MLGIIRLANALYARKTIRILSDKIPKLGGFQISKTKHSNFTFGSFESQYIFCTSPYIKSALLGDKTLDGFASGFEEGFVG